MTTLQLPANIFSKARTATARNTYPDKPLAGRYIVRLNHVASGATGNEGELDRKYMVKVNYTVLALVREAGGQPTHRVGDICEQVLWANGSKYAPEYFARGMKDLMLGLNEDLDPEEMTDDEFDAACREVMADPCPVTGFVMEMDNTFRWGKNQLDDEGHPRKGESPYVTVGWTGQLSADEIKERLDESVIEKYELLD